MLDNVALFAHVLISCAHLFMYDIVLLLLLQILIDHVCAFVERNQVQWYELFACFHLELPDLPLLLPYPLTLARRIPQLMLVGSIYIHAHSSSIVKLY